MHRDPAPFFKCPWNIDDRFPDRHRDPQKLRRLGGPGEVLFRRAPPGRRLVDHPAPLGHHRFPIRPVARPAPFLPGFPGPKAAQKLPARGGQLAAKKERRLAVSFLREGERKNRAGLLLLPGLAQETG